MKKEFRFPSILGVIILLVALFVGVYLTKSKTSFKSSASGTCSPDSVQITNTTHNSASVSFITSSKCLTSVSINDQTFSDFKDTPGNIHHIEVKHLSENKEYSFTIISDGQNYDKGIYRFKTASTPSSTIPTSNLAWGKVYSPDHKTPGTGIVYINIPGASPLSSIITSDGNWSVSLANSLNDSKNNWFVPPAVGVSEEIIVISEGGVATQVSNLSTNNNPVPDITIGKNSLEGVMASPTSEIGKIDQAAPLPAQKQIDILNPKNGDSLSTNQPDFFGVAPINSSVIIEVHSDVAINGQTVSDGSGNWHWSPPSGLTPGEHTITVKVQNTTTGIWDTVVRKFTVLAADNSGPQYVASGSATLAPTTVPTLTPTNTPIPTARAARPSVTIKPPVTGNPLPTILIILSALIFFMISVKFIK